MKRTCLAIILVALVAIFFVASEASAMYNPATGTFLSRDPGTGGFLNRDLGPQSQVFDGSFEGPHIAPPFGQLPQNRFIKRDGAGSQYADGMNLYEYVRSLPTCVVDPLGLATDSPMAKYKNCVKAATNEKNCCMEACDITLGVTIAGCPAGCAFLYHPFAIAACVAICETTANDLLLIEKRKCLRDYNKALKKCGDLYGG